MLAKISVQQSGLRKASAFKNKRFALTLCKLWAKTSLHQLNFRRASFSHKSTGSQRPQDGFRMAPRRQKGQPSQRLRYNMGCGGIRGASYNPPHLSGVHGVIDVGTMYKIRLTVELLQTLRPRVWRHHAPVVRF